MSSKMTKHTLAMNMSLNTARHISRIDGRLYTARHHEHDIYLVAILLLHCVSQSICVAFASAVKHEVSHHELTEP